jgi:hypothetical protein
MNKEQLTKQLNGKVETTLRFIDEVLHPRSDVNLSLLEDFKKVLIDYRKSKDIQILLKLRVIDSRPVPEGAKTDYTTGMSLQLDGEYQSLGELINEIEDLVFKIEQI